MYGYRGRNPALLGQVLRVAYRCLAEHKEGTEAGLGPLRKGAPGAPLESRDDSSLLRAQVDLLFVGKVSRQHLQRLLVPTPKLVSFALSFAAALRDVHGDGGRSFQFSESSRTSAAVVCGCLYPDCSSALVLRPMTGRDTVDEGSLRLRERLQSISQCGLGSGADPAAPEVGRARRAMSLPDDFADRAVWMVELKPKRPANPPASALARSFRAAALAEMLSPFRIKQLHKARQRGLRGAAHHLSLYDPVELFSGREDRVRAALEALRTTPKQNLEVRRNGRVLTAAEVGRGAAVGELLDAVAAILVKERPLERLRAAIETLDFMGSPGAQALTERLLLLVGGDEGAALAAVEAASLRRIVGADRAAGGGKMRPSTAMAQPVPLFSGAKVCGDCAARRREAAALLAEGWGALAGAPPPRGRDGGAGASLKLLLSDGGGCSRCAEEWKASAAAAAAEVAKLDAGTCADLLARWNEAAAFADCSILVTMVEPFALLRQAVEGEGEGEGEAEGEGELSDESHDAFVGSDTSDGSISVGDAEEPTPEGAFEPRQCSVRVARRSTLAEPGVVFGGRLGALEYRVTIVDIAAKMSSRILERPRIGLEQVESAVKELGRRLET